MNLVNRELSWLSFNQRVLQEAADKTVPLVDRFRFLGIYSNNMDEFFRVRVANLRRMIELKKKNVSGYKGTTKELYKEIRSIVLFQQNQFETILNELINNLSTLGIDHIDENELDIDSQVRLLDFFQKELRHEIIPILLDKKVPFPDIRDYAVYLAVIIRKSGRKNKYAIIRIPKSISRFYVFQKENRTKIILIDDIIRFNLKSIFSTIPSDQIQAFEFKFTRDAELNIDEDISTSLYEKIEKSLKNRKKGEPIRFVYDEKMPEELLNYLLTEFGQKDQLNLIPGGKYHNFKDFIKFPNFGRNDLTYPELHPLNHPLLGNGNSMIDAVLKHDILLHFPYQRFSYLVDLLREAAIDPHVTSIKINVYRVASNSQILNALIAAVANGKKVNVIFELQARFDEENNLFWADKLKEAGAFVSYGLPHQKIHCKLLQIHRKTGRKSHFINYIGTGNFNEKTATIYSDLGLITTNSKISKEVEKVFSLIDSQPVHPIFRELLVSPFNTRRKLNDLINKEIALVKNGKKGEIKIKMNNLTDEKVIDKLQKASTAGVKIQLLIRGICCLNPDNFPNIQIISIIDRYLEHSRMMIFNNDGKPVYFISSGDLMERNLDKRIEVGVRITDHHIQKELTDLFNIQMKGNVKARILEGKFKNEYVKYDNTTFRAQEETYNYFKRKLLNNNLD